MQARAIEASTRSKVLAPISARELLAALTRQQSFIMMFAVGERGSHEGA